MKLKNNDTIDFPNPIGKDLVGLTAKHDTILNLFGEYVESIGQDVFDEKLLKDEGFLNEKKSEFLESKFGKSRKKLSEIAY